MSTLPIDRGWAWMVALGCFGMYGLVVGCLKVEGVFFVEFIEKYQASKSDTAWISALRGFLMLSIGPVANALCDYFSTRKVVIVGGFLASLGFMSSGFATQVWHLYITFGLLIGTGFGLAYAPSLVVLGQYFMKRRALANGLAGAGCGVGGFLMPFIVRLSVDEFGLQGGFIVVSAVVLNLVVVGALYRPLSSYGVNYERSKEVNKELIDDDKLTENGIHGMPNDNYLVRSTSHGDVRQIQNKTLQICEPEGPTPRSSSHSDVRQIKNKALQICDPDRLTVSLNDIQGRKTTKTRNSLHPNFLSNSNRIAVTTAMYSLSVENLDRSDGILDDSSEEDESKLQPWWKRMLCCFKDKSPKNKKKLFDCSLMKSPVFLLLLGAAAMGMGGYPILLLFLPSHMDDLNLTKQEAVIALSVCSVIDFIGRISVGWLTDHVPVKRYVYSVCLCVCGIATCVLIFLDSYAAMLVCACICGFFGAAYMSLNAVVFAEEMGVEVLSQSLGMCVLFQSLSQLIVNPIIGRIRDDTGSWIGALAFTGLLCTLAGVLLLLVPCARRYGEYRKTLDSCTIKTIKNVEGTAVDPVDS